MNAVHLTGRLTKDPEFRQTQSGIPCTRFTIAVDRPYQKDKQQEADFISCVAWRASAEFVSRNFSKGDPIEVSGSLRTGSYTDNNGVKHFTTDVLVDRVSFTISNKRNQNERTENATGNTGNAASEIGDLGEFEEILSDGEVPF